MNKVKDILAKIEAEKFGICRTLGIFKRIDTSKMCSLCGFRPDDLQGMYTIFAIELLEALREEVAAMKLVEDADNDLVEERIQSLIDELKAQYDKMKGETEKLGQEIEKLESEEWPKKGDNYYHINEEGDVEISNWDKAFLDTYRRDFCGIFRTYEEAEAKLAVVKATMSPTKRWVPNLGEEYWFVNDNGIAQQEKSGWEDGETDHYRIAKNNVHRSYDDAHAYARLLTEYGKSIVK